MFLRCLIMLTVLLGTPALAGVNYDNKTKVLTVTGATTQKLATDIFYAFDQNEILTVVLSGSGGDFYEGLMIGRTFKKHNVSIVVPENETCVSACAFAALADKNLILDGELLFHVPYARAMPTNLTTLELAQQFGATYMDAAAYVAEMGGSIRFIKTLLNRTTTCKFMKITEADEVHKLLSVEAAHDHIWIRSSIQDNCEMARLMQLMGNGP